MNRIALFIPGIAMLVVGATKVWMHTQSLQALLSVRCGPEGLSSAANGPTFWTSMFAGHCWGCPVSCRDCHYFPSGGDSIQSVG